MKESAVSEQMYDTDSEQLYKRIWHEIKRSVPNVSAVVAAGEAMVTRVEKTIFYRALGVQKSVARKSIGRLVRQFPTGFAGWKYKSAGLSHCSASETYPNFDDCSKQLRRNWIACSKKAFWSWVSVDHGEWVVPPDGFSLVRDMDIYKWSFTSKSSDSVKLSEAHL